MRHERVPQWLAEVGEFGQPPHTERDRANRRSFAALWYAATRELTRRGWGDMNAGSIVELYVRSSPTPLLDRLWLSPTGGRLRIRLDFTDPKAIQGAQAQLASHPGLREFGGAQPVLRTQPRKAGPYEVLDVQVGLPDLLGDCTSSDEMAERIAGLVSLVLDTVDPAHRPSDGAEVQDLTQDPDRPAARGAGFGRPEQNARVERAAVARATTDLEAEGWEVQSVERDRVGYDLRCSRGSERRHVEVKGVGAGQAAFIITEGEVRAAKSDPHFWLYLVTDVLSGRPNLLRLARRDFLRRVTLQPIAYRAVLAP